jgi:hypothetical protein
MEEKGFIHYSDKAVEPDRGFAKLKTAFGQGQ